MEEAKGNSRCLSESDHPSAGGHGSECWVGEGYSGLPIVFWRHKDIQNSGSYKWVFTPFNSIYHFKDIWEDLIIAKTSLSRIT